MPFKAGKVLGNKPGMVYVPAAGVIVGTANEIAAADPGPSRQPVTEPADTVGVYTASTTPAVTVMPPMSVARHPRGCTPVLNTTL